MNVTKYLNDGSDNMDVLAKQVDPLAYAENLTMSKLVVDATGDEFFQPQDDDFWWCVARAQTAAAASRS